MTWPEQYGSNNVMDDVMPSVRDDAMIRGNSGFAMDITFDRISRRACFGMLVMLLSLLIVEEESSGCLSYDVGADGVLLLAPLAEKVLFVALMMPWRSFLRLHESNCNLSSEFCRM